MFNDFFPAIISLAILAAAFLYAYLSDPYTNPNAGAESVSLNATVKEIESPSYGEQPEVG